MHASNPQYYKDHILFKLDFDLAPGIVGSLHCRDLVVMLSSNHVIAGSTRTSAVVFKVSSCKKVIA